MTLKAFCARVGLLGLLTSNALASMPGDGAADANDADTGALELFNLLRKQLSVSVGQMG
jgi:hypothetical protein